MCPEVLGSLQAIFWSPRSLMQFILFYFSKFSLIGFSFNYASIQWRNNHVSGVDIDQGPQGLRESLQAIFWGLRFFHVIYFILFLKIFVDRFLFQLCFYPVA